MGRNSTSIREGLFSLMRPALPQIWRAKAGVAGEGVGCASAQEGLELREGFFDGVHVGTVRGQISQLGSRRLNELLNPWSLVARRLSITTMSPFESVGTRHFSTHSSKVAAFIGLSKAFWATRPRDADRRPATVTGLMNALETCAHLQTRRMRELLQGLRI